jgi:hypothetical protein
MVTANLHFNYKETCESGGEFKNRQGDNTMNDKHENNQFRPAGKGFILKQMEGIIGRALTQTYVDHKKKTYVKINGEFIPLTEQHSYLPAN